MFHDCIGGLFFRLRSRGFFANRTGIVKFTVEDNDEFARIHTEAMAITIYKNPFLIDAHRADGSMIMCSSRDENGHGWAYATLNDEFLVRRKCRREDAFSARFRIPE